MPAGHEGSLEGQVALVTGAGSHGIGRAIAAALAARGADIAIHAHGDPAVAEALGAEIRRMGRRAEVLMADFSDPSAARGVVGETIARLGKLDILVNNTGFVVRKPFFELTDGDFDAMLAVNLRSYFAGAQEAARHMVARNFPGRIIMISSVNQQLVVRGQACYCATKGGVMQLAKAMALELAPYRITVNLIAPGTIETDFNRHMLTDPAFRKLREEPVPLGRLGSPEDIAAAAVYLASPEASYVTGSTITVDGGLSLP
jgi:NAD(P)-dependent dehydrogenase (short-subunit alcohol dehydrogenase family)